ncbi:MAG: glycosyltransferase family 2 protein [Pseudobutyrivibrio sp.]|nr:glycosyltransferase family 2 protein [Pseudobutyrivibrio sp.]
MTFSIIIPVFNMEKYLKECLASVVAQTFKDYEIILVDDGSTDSSAYICDEFAKDYEELCKVIHKDNGGLSSARNAGLDVAEGEWIVFLDSDDYISSDLLEVVAEKINKFSADLYSYNARRVSADGIIQEKIIYNVENIIENFVDEPAKKAYLLNNILQYKDGWEAWNRVYKREIIQTDEIRFVNTNEVFAEDLCFFLDYFLHVKSIYKICNVMYFYRRTPNSILDNLKQEKVLIKLYTLIEHFYKSCKCYNRYLYSNFEDVYRKIADYHVKYKLDTLSNEEIINQFLWIRNNTKYGKKWVEEKVVLVERENGKR